MSFILYKSDTRDYTETIDRKLNNTLNFENISNRDEYANISLAQLDTTSKGLHLHENLVLEKMIPIIEENSDLLIVKADMLRRYKYRPKAVSLDQYGVSDFWYIILAVNRFSSPFEFTNFNSLLIPNRKFMDKFIDNELYTRPVVTRTRTTT